MLAMPGIGLRDYKSLYGMCQMHRLVDIPHAGSLQTRFFDYPGTPAREAVVKIIGPFT